MSTPKNLYIGLPRVGAINGQVEKVISSTVSGLPGATAATDFATALAAYDAIGAAIIAISGDTYSNTTHHFTTGGSTGLNSAQLHTEMTALNAMIDDFLTVLTDINAIVSGGAGANTDVEIRMQVDNGTAATGLKRKDVITITKVLEQFVEQGGLKHAGADLPVS